MSSDMKFWGTMFLVIVVMGTILVGAVTPAWSDTGVVVSDTSQFSGTSWQRVVVVQSAHHGVLTFAPDFWHGCGSDNNPPLVSVNQTVGLWSTYTNCVFIVVR